MNTYSKKTIKVGGSYQVWIPPIQKSIIGGRLDLTKYKSKLPMTIPAGSMVHLEYAGGVATIVLPTDAEMLPKVNYLTQNDISLDADVVNATVTCVYAGAVYADYIPEVPESVKAQLPQIQFTYLTKRAEAGK